MKGDEVLAELNTLESIQLRPFSIIAIGASAGGVTAVRNLIVNLDKSLRTPIAVVQHMAQSARISVDLVYGPGQSRKVLEIEDKMILEPGKIYMSTPGYHMTIEKEGYFSLSQDEPVLFARPSIDVFFASVAAAYGAGAIGILLTGASADGAKGLALIGNAGGLTIVQDPKDADYDTMPLAAIETNRPDFILPVMEIARVLNSTRFVGEELTT